MFIDVDFGGSRSKNASSPMMIPGILLGVAGYCSLSFKPELLRLCNGHRLARALSPFGKFERGSILYHFI